VELDALAGICLKNTTFIWANSERTNKNLPPRRVWSFRAFIVEAFMKKTRRQSTVSQLIARMDGNKMKRTEETQTGFRGGAAAAVPVCPYVVFPAVGRGESDVRGLQRRESGQRGKVGQHLGGNWVIGKGNETV
jgi:hypothetical protein